MADVTVDVRGISRVRNNLRRLASDNKRIVDKRIKKHLREVAKKAKRDPYPAPPPGSTYVRTGKLKNSYYVRDGTLGNSRDGGPYVIDQNKQARIHRGRHKTLQERELEARPELTKLLTEDLVALADG